jgi:PAS domain S-box-containing protein
MKTKSPLNWKVQLAFGSAFLTLLVVGAISYRGMVGSSESDRWVRHTHEVLENLQDLLSAAQRIESSYRGFALTGEDRFLEPYHDSLLRVAQDEATVRHLTMDNPTQQRQIPALEGLAAQKIQFGERVIRLRRTMGLEAAAEVIRSGAGQRIMDEFQGVVRGMQREELRLLALRDAEARRRFGQTKTVLILGTVLGWLIAAAAGWSVHHDNSRRGLAEEALRDSEEKYRVLLDGVQDYAIFMLDPRGQVASWNAGAERIKGYKAEEIIGQNFSRFYLQKDIDQGKPEEELQVAAASGRSEAEHWRVRKDGSQFWANVVITAARNSSGVLVGFSEISRDISERKKAEEAQRGSEERLRMAVEAGEMGTWFWNIQRDEITWSAKFRTLLGLTSDAKLTYQEILGVVHPDDRQRIEQSVKDTIERGVPYDIEYRAVWPDSSVHWLAAKGREHRSPEGVAVHMLGVVMDVTERKDAEKHLAQMEGRYRGLLEAAPDAMVVVNQSGEIVLLNVQAEKQFGYRRDELVGQKVKNIIPEGFAERLVADGTRTAAEALAQQIGTGTELRGRRKDGSEFPIEIMLSPLDSAEGIQVTAAIRDVTTRKTAEKALREAEERFRALANNISQLAWMADEKGYIFWYNQRWFDYTGTTLEEMAGWGWQKVHHPDHVQQVVTKISKCFQTGEVWEDTFPLRGRDGDYRWFLSRAVPIRDLEGKVSRWFGTNTDITERKKSEERLLKTVGELKRSNDELQQFAYVASHDLQEPLRMVASYTQLLAKRYKGRLDSEADEFIAYAVDGANRMQGLIQDLLAYSRAGINGKVLREISTENALKEALTNLRVMIEESGAVVTHDSLPAITTDDTQLAQVFQNLVGNAIKYHSAEVPHVHVSATKNGGKEWIFSVRDNGLGIAPQYFERIFILFQRLHGRTEFKGTGIGLAICKKILERLGGRIWVESEPEKGSTFYFALPERVGK